MASGQGKVGDPERSKLCEQEIHQMVYEPIPKCTRTSKVDVKSWIASISRKESKMKKLQQETEPSRTSTKLKILFYKVRSIGEVFHVERDRLLDSQRDYMGTNLVEAADEIAKAVQEVKEIEDERDEMRTELQRMKELLAQKDPPTELSNLSEISSKLEKQLDVLQKTVKQIKETAPIQGVGTYANAVKTNRHTSNGNAMQSKEQSGGKNEPKRTAIIIVPKNDLASERMDIRTKLKVEKVFSKTGTGVLDARYTGHNRLRMEIENEDQVQSLIDAVNGGEHLVARKVMPADPTIIIKEINGRIPSATLIEDYLIKQNPELRIGDDPKSKFKYLFTRKSYSTKLKNRDLRTPRLNCDSDNYDAVMSVSPEVYKRLKDSEMKVYLEESRVRVNRFVDVRQCVKCARLGHTESKCQQQKPNCRYCSEEHRTEECPNKEKPPCCNNCKNHNQISITSKKLDTQHEAWKKNCPMMVKFKEKMYADVEW